jgi:predicted membrane protein
MSTAIAFRPASLAAALILSAGLLLWPRILGPQLGPVEHSLLPVLLLGISGAFVSGFGYRPDHRLARILLSPIASWVLMGLGITVLALRGLAP